MVSEYSYVVQFDNGNYFTGGVAWIESDVQTMNLAKAKQYTFEWQPIKDDYLTVFLEESNLSYELVKVKNTVELIG